MNLGMTKKPFWVLTLIGFGVFMLCAWLTDSKPLAEGIRFLQVSAAFAVFVAYSREAWTASNKQRLESEDYLLLGITLSWFSSAVLGTLLLLWRLSGQPSWLVNNDFVNAMMTISMYSSVLHLLAPGAIGGVVPRKNMVRLGFVAGVAFFVAILAITQTPRIKMFVRMLRPFVEQPDNKYDAPTSNLLFKDVEKPRAIGL